VTLLGWYVFVGLPIIVLGMGYGAVLLARHTARADDRAQAARGTDAQKIG
jgi:hypothetical protein